MASRRLERETRRSQRSPGPRSAAAASSPAKNTSGSASGAFPNRGPGKIGVRPPPPTVSVPHAMSPLLPTPLPRKQGTAGAAAAEFMRRRSLNDFSGRVDSVDGTAHRGSIASTRRSILSFVSARSNRSIAGEGDGDDFDLYAQNVDDSDGSTGTGGGGSGSGSGSGTDSDLEEFFDAMAEADEGKYVVVFQAKRLRRATVANILFGRESSLSSSSSS